MLQHPFSCNAIMQRVTSYMLYVQLFGLASFGYSLQNIQWWGWNEVREIAIMRVPLCFYSPLSPIILSTPRVLGTGNVASARDIFLPDFIRTTIVRSRSTASLFRSWLQMPENRKCFYNWSFCSGMEILFSTEFS